MTTYQAIVSRDERYWAIRVPGLGTRPDHGLPTMAVNLAEVEPVVRDLISLYLNVPVDSFDIEIHIELPESVRRHLESASRHADIAASAQCESARERRAAARELKDRGLTVRDIGRVLGVSHQRAQQLASG